MMFSNIIIHGAPSRGQRDRATQLLWSEQEMFSIGSCIETFGPRLVLFKKVAEPLGGEASPKEVGHWR